MRGTRPALALVASFFSSVMRVGLGTQEFSALARGRGAQYRLKPAASSADRPVGREPTWLSSPSEACRRSGRLVLQAVRHLAAALGELGHHLLVQPDVHFRRAVERALVAQLLRQLLAGAQAGVELEQLHEID